MGVTVGGRIIFYDYGVLCTMLIIFLQNNFIKLDASQATFPLVHEETEAQKEVVNL